MKLTKLATLTCVSSIAAASALFTPALAAEKVRLLYGPAERSIPVSSLSSFANTGEVDGQLSPYFEDLSNDEVQEVQNALNYRVNVNFVPFSKFLNRDLGKGILSEMTTIVEPSAPSVDGVQALRAAFVNASKSGHFSLIDLIEEYPNSNINLNVKIIAEDVAVVEEVAADVRKAEHALSGIHDLAGDLELLAESFINLESGGQLVSDAAAYVKKVEAFADSSGLTLTDLDSTTPPEGSISLSKADIWKLYQDLLALESEAEQFLDDPLTKGTGVDDY